MKSQAEEIVERNEGNINELILHINKEIHLNSIMNKNLTDGMLKTISQQRAIQLQLIKTELQISLVKYNKELIES